MGLGTSIHFWHIVNKWPILTTKQNSFSTINNMRNEEDTWYAIQFLHEYGITRQTFTIIINIYTDPLNIDNR